MRKDKKYKILIILFSMLVVIFVVANVTTYAITKKNLFNYFFSREGKELDGIWTRLQKDGEQSVVIDDYTITLEEYLYDGATYNGHAIFSVRKEGKDMREEMVEENVVYGINSVFGENGRFLFDVNGSMTSENIYKKEKDVMYVYYKFDISDVWGFNNNILIYDYKTHGNDWKKEENAMYEFILKDNVGTEMYEINNDGVKSHMYVSPFAIKIINFNLVDNIESLELVFEDDSKEIIVDKNEIKIDKYYGKSSQNGIYAYYILFEEELDIENIKEVNLNGSHLKRLSDTERGKVEMNYNKIYEEK
ncbi:MAG: hypothetical protein IJC76_08710 [Lachnospiraceae bacterium]|nr:hypothetical protein [Lachnospiraceae bacterium]